MGGCLPVCGCNGMSVYGFQGLFRNGTDRIDHSLTVGYVPIYPPSKAIPRRSGGIISEEAHIL